MEEKMLTNFVYVKLCYGGGGFCCKPSPNLFSPVFHIPVSGCITAGTTAEISPADPLL
jgi:hypothetical protein